MEYMKKCNLESKLKRYIQTKCPDLSFVYMGNTLNAIEIHSVTLDSEYGGEDIYNFNGAAKLKDCKTGGINTYEISGKVSIKEDNGDSILEIVGNISASNKR